MLASFVCFQRQLLFAIDDINENVSVCSPQRR